MVELELLFVLVLVLLTFFLQLLFDPANFVIVDGFQLSLGFKILAAQSFHRLGDLFLNQIAFTM